MKRLAALLSCLIFAANATARPIIVWMSRSMYSMYGSQLAALLGPSYKVIEPSASKIRTVMPPVPDISFQDFVPEDWKQWQRYVDDFVPEAEERITPTSNRRTKIWITIPPLILEPSMSTFETFVSLCKQIAYETDCPLLQLRPDQDVPRQMYLTIVKAERNPGTWRVVSATSEQSDEGPAKNAIDNNPDTYWHTRYDPNPTKVPHEIVIDLGNTQTMNGFSYLARQDGGVNGRVKDFELYVSDDLNQWGAPAIKGTLQNTMDEQKLLFPKPAKGRYLKFVALSEVNGNIWTSIAELGILPAGDAK